MNTLLVLLGPTGVGKTDISLQVAHKLGAPILSADSRQIYAGMGIVTAAPTPQQRASVTHYFVETLSPEQYYSASEYEREAIPLIESLLETHPTVVMTGGSMMYIDAVCFGIDEIPTVDPALRKDIYELYRTEGLDPIRMQLKLLDPVFYGQVDLKNPKRVIHALEICLMSGKPYSSLRTDTKKKRPFRIVKIGLTRDRPELYERINHRVDGMMEQGLLEEARKHYPIRQLNATNTVGYKELFAYFDGNGSLEEAVDKIKQHTRQYARKQMTWFKRDQNIHWINLSDPGADVIGEDLYKLAN